MGFYLTVDVANVQTSEAMPQSSLNFQAPQGSCIVGRIHTGDENGMTQFKYAPLIVDPNSGSSATIEMNSPSVLGTYKQSDFSMQLPPNRVITGWQHLGDENGTTVIFGSFIKVDGVSSLTVVNNVGSGDIEESAGIWWVGPSIGQLMAFMTGTSHMGDENGTTTYTGGLIWATTDDK